MSKKEQEDNKSVDENNAEQPQIQFTPDDLAAAVILIDLAADEGAYKGWEKIQQAMNTRQRLLLFHNHWKAQLEETSKKTFDGVIPTPTQGDK